MSQLGLLDMEFDQPEPDSLVDLRSLEYVSNYDGHLMCPICHCPFIRPIRLQCDHIFCQTCLNCAIKAGPTHRGLTPDDFACPTCRAPTMATFTNVPRLLLSMCDDIRVKCPFSSEGCQEVVQRGHVQSHVDKYCDYRLMHCPDVSCDKRTRKKDLDPNGRCLHELRKCVNCEESIAEQDLDAHTKELCPSLKVTCPDCQISLYRRVLAEHIENCPNSMRACGGAKYGCLMKLPKTAITVHEMLCPLVTLGPYLESQASRMASMESTIRQLRQRNEILEDGIANIRSTLAQMTLLPSDGRGASPAATQSGTGTPSPSQPSNISPSSAEVSINLSPSNATTYLLSLHETLRDEMSHLGSAITDLDARASMAIMNESLRIREDMAHINAGVNSLRMQVHWLMNPRLHQGQREVNSGGTRGSGGGDGVRTLGIGNPAAGRSSASTPASGALAGRRLSDTTREGTKL